MREEEGEDDDDDVGEVLNLEDDDGTSKIML